MYPTQNSELRAQKILGAPVDSMLEGVSSSLQLEQEGIDVGDWRDQGLPQGANRGMVSRYKNYTHGSPSRASSPARFHFGAYSASAPPMEQTSSRKDLQLYRVMGSAQPSLSSPQVQQGSWRPRPSSAPPVRVHYA
jgi:hypothetical protein